MNDVHAAAGWVVDQIRVNVHDTVAMAGEAAAAKAAEVIRSAIATRGKARVIFASAPSQLEMVSRLVGAPDLLWSRVEAFHMDEYVGLPTGATQSFGRWISEQLAEAGPGRLALMEPDGDPAAEARRYGALLAAETIDLTCMGIGVNGHIAFNEPGQCSFDDTEMARVTTLQQASRSQQVDDGCFDQIDDVPGSAVTLTIPALLRARSIVMMVPGGYKAAAVAEMLSGPVGPDCPATALRGREGVHLFLDSAAASKTAQAGRPAGGEPTTTSRTVLDDYFERVVDHLVQIRDTERQSVARAAELVADHVERDELVYVYGPGGHSNLAAQEVFFRAGGLVNISAILDEGTLLSSGALRSMAVERTPGYGSLVITDNRIGQDDLLILVNAYGINAALIDAALTAQERGATLIGVSSRDHAECTAPDHPARHPSGQNLHDLVDVHIDSKVPVGDAMLRIDRVAEPVAAVSTFTNAYALNCVVASAIALLAERRVEPTIWRSGNAPGGDDQHAGFVNRFRGRVRWL